MVLILIYVDDLLITGDNADMIVEAKQVLRKQFKLKDLGDLKFFSRIEVLRSKSQCYSKSKKTYFGVYF